MMGSAILNKQWEFNEVIIIEMQCLFKGIACTV